MTKRKFQARVAAAGDSLQTIDKAGYIEVLKNDHHVARYLVGQAILWFEPEENHQAWIQAKAERDWPPSDWPNVTGPEDFPESATWPPICPECGTKMVLKYGGRDDRAPFWSCRLFDNPGRICRGRRPFTLHPEELAELREMPPMQNGYWSPGANKASEAATYRVRWRRLAFRSLDRLQTDTAGGD